MTIFALTVFLGSFLLFQVQPLIGRYILPWFGGTPAVWTTCMLFFQTALLAGYAYAHSSSGLGRKRQVYLHLALLALSLFFLNISPSGDWKPAPGDEPTMRILVLLAATIGIPYLLLSSTAPLTQHWFAVFFPGKSPYRLYALSNASSLLGLLTYPFLIEPHLTLGRQAVCWGALFVIYAVCSAWCAVKFLKQSPSDILDDACSEPSATEEGAGENTGIPRILLWVSLSACGSALLVAVTNQLCQEVAVIPFLWVTPLVLYLATFTICFNTEKGYDRILWSLLFVGALIPGLRVLNLGPNLGLTAQILIYLAMLFTCCMVCHGELANLKPEPRRLTGYYLAIAAGGSLGGASVAIAAPLLFHELWEYPLVLCAAAVTIVASWYRQGVVSRMPPWLMVPMCAGVFILFVVTGKYMLQRQPGDIHHVRNFYGTLRVLRLKEDSGEKLTLMHGRIAHGAQYPDEKRQHLPTAYYGPESGAGLALRLHPRRSDPDSGRRSIKAGMIGLGAGTLAAYGQKGDRFRFYEINPAVIAVSDRFFSYCRNSAATVQVVEGDARIMLEAELARNEQQKFDVLVVDAFSSDAIPIHLLTRECFDLYRRHLNPDGLLLFHITNRFLDLAPVIRAHAEKAGMRAILISSPADNEKGIWKADWLIVTGNAAFAASKEVFDRKSTATSGSLLWTDDFAALWQVIKR